MRLLTLRAMHRDDLELVAQWLETPHIVKWYVTDSVAEEIEDIRHSLAGAQPTHMLVAEEDGRPIGWCQWYLLRDYPQYANDVGGQPGDVGIDYAIGDPGRIAVGLGTQLIHRLMLLIREIHPGAELVADPAAANQASRRVLEKNGFRLIDERTVPSDRTEGPMAIYRL